MEIQHVDMDSINIQNNKPQVSALEGFAPQYQGGSAGNAKERQGDSFEADSLRQALREMCETGQAEDHVDDIISSGIEPDCLRAELAFRNAEGDKTSVSIIINYLAGNFKEAVQKTQQLEADEKLTMLSEFNFVSNYFSGNFETACEAAKNLSQTLNLSPLFCYAYADMLLSLGYIDEARAYTKKYVILARKYLKNFVSEKEKYEQEKKRREQNSQRGRQGNRNGDSADTQKDKPNPIINNAPLGTQQNDTSFNHSTTLLELFARRKALHEAIKIRNLNYDKRPLMFELEDIDAQIGQLTWHTTQNLT